jgi:hypothetical protein
MPTDLRSETMLALVRSTRQALALAASDIEHAVAADTADGTAGALLAVREQLTFAAQLVEAALAVHRAVRP